MYANQSDLTAYLNPATVLPPDIDRLLERASELIDQKTFGKAADNPEAAKMAVCAQIEYWLETDEQTDITGPLGTVRLDNFTMNHQLNILAPRAYRYLLQAGLLYTGVGLR